MSRLCRQQKGENMGNATIIAVDTGNKLMKTQNFVFSAGVKDHMGRMPATLEDIEVLQYQKHFYTVSEQHTSQTMYARYERGANEMPIHHLVTLCRLYNVSADYFLDTAPVSDRKRRRGAKKA